MQFNLFNSSICFEPSNLFIWSTIKVTRDIELQGCTTEKYHPTLGLWRWYIIFTYTCTRFSVPTIEPWARRKNTGLIQWINHDTCEPNRLYAGKTEFNECESPRTHMNHPKTICCPQIISSLYYTISRALWKRIPPKSQKLPPEMMSSVLKQQFCWENEPLKPEPFPRGSRVSNYSVRKAFQFQAHSFFKNTNT